jgi:predicted short-subunit dehydrogenase-like oxidoreductase (DUF2520 family)
MPQRKRSVPAKESERKPRPRGVKGKGKTAKGADSVSPSALSEARPPADSTVAIIGAGRLGTALARALGERGYTLTAFVARHQESAARAARLAGTKAHALGLDELASIPRTRLYLLTTPDDELKATAERLAAVFAAPDENRRGGVKAGRVALHASGALDSDVLAPLRACGFAVGSMHPLVSVSEPRTGAEKLRTAFYCVEGDARAARAARQLVRALGGQSFRIGPRSKSLYHAAAVMASGHVVALFDLATRMLVRCELSPRRARRVLLPLLQSTLENLSREDASRALTGPFARGDIETMRNHLHTLRRMFRDDLSFLNVYAALGGHSLKLRGDGAANRRLARQFERAVNEVLSSRDDETSEPS